MTHLKWMLVWLGIEIAGIIALLFFSGAWMLTWWQAAILIVLLTAVGKTNAHWERHLNPPLPAGATVLAINEHEITIVQHGRQLFDIKSWRLNHSAHASTTLDIELATPDLNRLFIGKADA